MSTPAPAVLNLPPRSLRKAPRQAHRDATVQAPGCEVSIERLLVTFSGHGVCGVPTSAVHEYVQILIRDLRTSRPTIVPASSVEAALEEACEQHDALLSHDMGCECPECFPVDDDAQHYCADEGHVVLSQGSAYYGVL